MRIRLASSQAAMAPRRTDSRLENSVSEKDVSGSDQSKRQRALPIAHFHSVSDGHEYVNVDAARVCQWRVASTRRKSTEDDIEQPSQCQTSPEFSDL